MTVEKKLKFEILRQQADKLHKKDVAKEHTQLSESEALKLIHELRVHQIELELQNEELVLAKNAAHEATEKYIELYNFAPTGYFTLSKGIEIIEINHSGAKMLGKERSLLLSNHFGLFISQDTLPIFNAFFQNVLKNNNKQICEIKLNTIDNHQKWLHLEGMVVGNSEQCLINAVDISQRIKTEAKNLHADRMANLGEMASGMAHEINQPLNIISMVMDKILFETAKTETINIEFLKNKSDRIFENITRIRNIIDHVRAFSRNDDNYVPVEFDINVSIGNAVSMITEQFKHLGIRLNLKLDKQIPLIYGNTYKFEQVIINLLVNALDAVVEKKSKKKEFSDMIVCINTYQENQFLIAEITDNGIGITNYDIDEVMLPFYTTKEEGKGTGLGLSISYQIIKEMNGTFEITSNSLSGTKIKLVFNLQNEKLK